MAMAALTRKQQTCQKGPPQQQQYQQQPRGDAKELLAVPCTHPTCRNRRSHCAAECFTRAKEITERLNKRREKANVAQDTQEMPSEHEAAEFAGNASAFDFTDPHTPLVSDAETDWIADTGATVHMIPHCHWFTSYTPFKRSICLADSKIIHSVGKGSVCFLPFINGKPQRLLEFHDVLHVSDLPSNLLSVLHLSQHKDYTVSIRKNLMSFSRNNSVLFTASVSNNCARLNGQTIPISEYARLVSTCPLDSSLWHRRFCHLNKGDVHKLLSGALVSGITVKSKSDSMDPICESCLAGKQHRTAVPLIAQNRATKPLLKYMIHHLLCVFLSLLLSYSYLLTLHARTAHVQ